MSANPCGPSACGTCPTAGFCGDPDDLPPEELPADEWCDIFRVDVLDPDGWRDDGLPWDAPITEREFHRRASVSTVRYRRDGDLDGLAEWAARTPLDIE